MAIKIICRPNGPYLVENDGSIELYDAIGTKVDLTGKAKFALCRCGGPTPKPFCARAPQQIGLHATEAAGGQHETCLRPPEGWALPAQPSSPSRGLSRPAAPPTPTK